MKGVIVCMIQWNNIIFSCLLFKYTPYKFSIEFYLFFKKITIFYLNLIRNYSVEISALKKQEELRMQVHETESLTLSKSSTAVIDVLRKEYKDLRTETEEKIIRLEGSIVELSRECQQVSCDFQQENCFWKLLFCSIRLGRHYYRKRWPSRRKWNCCGRSYIHYKRQCSRWRVRWRWC